MVDAWRNQLPWKVQASALGVNTSMALSSRSPCIAPLLRNSKRFMLFRRIAGCPPMPPTLARIALGA